MNDAPENIDDVACAKAWSRLEGKTLAGEDIDDGQYAKGPPITHQPVVHKVHAPHMVCLRCSDLDLPYYGTSQRGSRMHLWCVFPDRRRTGSPIGPSDRNPGGVADTSYLYRCDTHPPNGENYSLICDPRLDAAERLELGAVDPALQRCGDIAMQRELVKHVHVLNLGFIAGALATRRGLKGFRPSSIVRTYWNPWEWRW